jgi:tetratricopeptide (TPR) repeat protein
MLDRLRVVRTPQIASVLVLLFTLTRGAAADDSRDAAGAHYARGLELAARGGYEAALQEFNQAYSISPQFAVLYNIGQAQVALGQLVEAIESLSQYLRDGQDRVPRSRRQQVKASIALLESRLAELTITTDRPNASIDVDGREVGATPLSEPVRLAPGAHKISAASEGASPLIEIVTLGKGQRQTLELKLPAPSAKAAAEAARAAVAEAVAAAAAATRAAAVAEKAARVATVAAQRARAEASTRESSAAAARAASAAGAAAAAEIVAHARATPGGR